MWRLGLAMGVGVGVGLALSCTSSSVFVCAADDDCDGGRCEGNGYCSFPDEDCASGWAYGDLSAPQLAGECVDDDGGTTTGPDPTTSAGPGSAEADSGPPLPTATDDAADSTGPVDPGTTTSTTAPPVDTAEPVTDDGPPCPDVEESIIWADEGMLTAPMQLAVATGLPTMPLYAYSEEAEMGSITVEAVLECDATIYGWALVLDPSPGIGGDDPDSYYVSLDGGPELPWEYGCAFASGDPEWRWVAIDPLGCGDTPMGLPVSSGPHQLTARNIEPANEGVTGGIAAVFLSTDQGSDPNVFFPVN